MLIFLIKSMKKINIAIIAITLFTTIGFSQNLTRTDSISVQAKNKDIIRRHSLGSTLFLLGDFAPGDAPCFSPLDFGHHFKPEDLIIRKAIN